MSNENDRLESRVSRLPGNPLGPGRRSASGKSWLLCLVLALTAMSGCTSWRDYIHNGFKVGPNYCKPAAPVADDWIETKNPQVNNSSTDDAAWWQSLRDPTLDALIDTAYRQNLSVREAGARILEARHNATLWPEISFPKTRRRMAAILEPM